MALVGRLEDVPAPEILQFLAMSDKTGKLVLTRGTEECLMVFRNGRIIYAASSSIRETFGSVVSGLGLVDEASLGEALHRQHHGQEEKRLGTILVEMGCLSRPDLEDAMRQQVLRVLREVFAWHRGYFTFRPMLVDDHGEVEVDARDLLIETPLDAQRLTLDAARSHDEADRGRPRTRRSSTLDQVVTQIPAPRITAELVREVLQEAAKVMLRVVVLAVQGPFANGVAQRGLSSDKEPPSQRIRGLRLPLDEASTVASAVTRRRTQRGRPSTNRLDLVLRERVGLPEPIETVAIPVIAGDDVALVIYGDNGTGTLDSNRLATLEERLSALGSVLKASVPTSRSDRGVNPAVESAGHRA